MIFDEFRIHWTRLANVYPVGIVPNKQETWDTYFDKFKSWTAETFGLVCDRIMDNERVSFSNPLQPSMFFRNQIIVIEEERIKEKQEHKDFNLYKDGVNKASPYGRRVLRFCIAVSSQSPKLPLDKRIKCPKDHSKIEGCLKEFEANLK